MDKKIIYVTTTFPFPADNGGTQGILRHVQDIVESKFNNQTKYIFYSPEYSDKKPDFDLDYILITSKHKTLSYQYKIIKKFLSLFTKWTFNMCLSKDIAGNNTDIGKFKPDLIILDGMHILPMLHSINNYKFIYIANNIEANYENDILKLEKNILFKIYLLINKIKTAFWEKYIWKKANAIICVSTSDYKIISSHYKDKTYLLPHKIVLQTEQWSLPEKKVLFFCGPMNFYPNREAIEWIATKLAPVLSDDIIIKIAGKGTDTVPNEWKKDNIEFLGYVSKEDLINLYKTSSAFICPIVYGSGVKIKITEALSYGIPIIATKESLEGLDYMTIEPLINREKLQITKENIDKLLKNDKLLNNYSAELVTKVQKHQNDNRNTLEKIIENCIEERG